MREAQIRLKVLKRSWPHARSQNVYCSKIECRKITDQNQFPLARHLKHKATYKIALCLDGTWCELIVCMYVNMHACMYVCTYIHTWYYESPQHMMSHASGCMHVCIHMHISEYNAYTYEQRFETELCGLRWSCRNAIKTTCRRTSKNQTPPHKMSSSSRISKLNKVYNCMADMFVFICRRSALRSRLRSRSRSRSRSQYGQSP